MPPFEEKSNEIFFIVVRIRSVIILESRIDFGGMGVSELSHWACELLFLVWILHSKFLTVGSGVG